MKILMIGSLLTVNGGVQQYIRNLLLHMDLTRYPVDLLATPAATRPACRFIPVFSAITRTMTSFT